MKRKLLVVLLIGVVMAFVLPFGATLADDEKSCSLSVSSQELVKGNHVEVTVTVTGADWVTVAINANDIADVQNGKTAGFDMPFSAGPHQTISGHVTGTTVNCGDPLSIHIAEWDPAPTPTVPGNGGSSPSTPVVTVGNAAFKGHGIDDCRAFVSVSPVRYDKKNNRVSFDIVKQFEDAQPFVVIVESNVWSLPLYPPLGNEGGKGEAWFNPPFEIRDLKGKAIGTATIYNKWTGVQCGDPIQWSIN